MADVAETVASEHENHLVGVVLTAIDRYQNGFDNEHLGAPEGAWSLRYLKKAYQSSDEKEQGVLFRKFQTGLKQHLGKYFDSEAFRETLPEHIKSYSSAVLPIAKGLLHGGGMATTSLVVTGFTPFWKVSLTIAAACYLSGAVMYSLVKDEETRETPKIQETLEHNLEDVTLMQRIFTQYQPTIEQALYAT